jgi:hypothetical protein
VAVGGVQININAEELRGLRDKLASFFPNKQAADVIGDAVRKAIQPMTRRLREITPVGPTGNLKRAVASKVVKYKQTGVAVGIVGYTRAGRGESQSAQGGKVRAGKDRAFHQWWLEFGVKQRVVSKFANKPYQRRSPTTPFTRVRLGQQETVRGKGVTHWVSGQNAYIASSYDPEKYLGPFEIVRVGKTSDGKRRVQTDPPYPNAFFKKSRTPIVIPPQQPGGRSGNPPVQTAFNQTQGEIASILQRELSLSLSQAWSSLRIRDTGSVSGTDTLGSG